MTEGETGQATDKKLPRRDWILLPAIGLLTIFALGTISQLVAWNLFPMREFGLEHCFVQVDGSGDARPVPNSRCAEQIPESKFLAEYAFNSHGHRAGGELTPKKPGSYRIVMIGSSFAMGLFVPREQTFAALLPDELSRRTGRKIEVYNEASGGEFRGGPFPAKDSFKQFDQVLAAAPDLILWIVTPNDIEREWADEPGAVLSAPDAPPKNLAEAWGWFTEKVQSKAGDTRSSVMLEHLLYGGASPSEYVNSYLQNEDDAAFLKDTPSAQWEHLREHFEKEAAEFEKRSASAGVPFVAVLVPNRAQAAMVSMGEWPAGYNPYRLDAELRAMIVSHGGTYIDILPGFRGVPNPERHYFPVDGHPDANAHAIISDLIAKELTSGAIPQLKASLPPPSTEGTGR
jgi:hypothetical protein